MTNHHPFSMDLGSLVPPGVSQGTLVKSLKFNPTHKTLKIRTSVPKVLVPKMIPPASKTTPKSSPEASRIQRKPNLCDP